MKYVYLSALLLLGLSCKQLSYKDFRYMGALNHNLEQSNEIIFSATKKIYQQLDKQMPDSINADENSWAARAHTVKIETASFINFVEGLKLELTEKANLDKSPETLSKYDNPSVIKQLFNTNRKAETLHNEVEQYKRNIFGNSEWKVANLKTDINEIMDPSHSSDYWKEFFDGKSVIAAIVVLNRFQNSARVIENRLVNYCYQMSIGTADGNSAMPEQETAN